MKLEEISDEISEIAKKFIGERVVFDNGTHSVGSFVVDSVHVNLDIGAETCNCRYWLCSKSNNCFTIENCRIEEEK